MAEEIPNIKTETTQETPLNLNTEENITEDDKSDNGLSQISEKKVNKMKKSHSKKKKKKKKKDQISPINKEETVIKDIFEPIPEKRDERVPNEIRKYDYIYSPRTTY